MSESVRSRRSARKPVAVRPPRPNPLTRCTGPAGGAARATDRTRQNAPHFPPSDATATTDPRVGTRELGDREVDSAAAGPRGARRTEHRRPEQTDDERQWKQALAGEIHDFYGLLSSALADEVL
jgi:hypothetical protein